MTESGIFFETAAMMVDHRLKVFCSVARTLNFSRAAEENFITQSAVSRIIKNLEDDLEVQLINRQRGKVSLTAIGKQFLLRAEEILQHYAVTVKEVDELANSVRGRLSVGTSTTVGRYVFPDILFSFQSRFPQVRIHHLIQNSRGILEALLAGDIEIGIVEDTVFYPGVITETYCEDELVIVVHPRHPWATQKEIRPEDLLEQPYIRREKGSGTRRLLENRLGDLGMDFSKLNVVMTTASPELVVQAVERGLGVTCVSAWVVRENLARGTLKAIPFRGDPLKRDFMIIRQKQELYSHVAETFLGFLREFPPSAESVFP